jgi:cytoskeletal protein CcmA (bactofilin family)
MSGVSIGGAPGFRHTGEKRGADMFKSKARDKALDAVANATEVIVQPPQRSVVEQPAARSEPTTKAGTISCIGSSMSIIGKIECNGPAQVFGRIEGELQASHLLIGDGAQVEGSIIAQDVTVCGRVKGTLRAARVKLRDGGAVEGDIFHRSLSIDENSLFEGSSRRVENPAPSSSADAKGSQKEDTQSPASAPLPPIDADLQHVESVLTQWSDLMVGQKQ